MRHETAMEGKRFGRLLVVKRHGVTNWNEITWICKCDCGKTAIVRGKNMRSGVTASCGCLKQETTQFASIKHGMKYSAEYSVWRGMLTRCHNKNAKGYLHYGGKGIFVCDAWRYDFMEFYLHIGNRPEGTSIDRIDGKKGYEPGNVRWADSQTQNRNRLNATYVPMPDGTKKHINDIATSLGLTRGAAYMRFKRGTLHV